MFAKLREIFVGQYIGAILIALLVWQAGVELVTRFARIVFWYINARRSVLAPSREAFPWEHLVFSAVAIALYLLITYALVRWLYGGNTALSQTQSEPPSDLQ
jgi:hypothetical protein